MGKNYSYTIIGKLFGVNKGTIFNKHKRNLSTRKKDSGPRIISMEQLKIITHNILFIQNKRIS